MSGSKCSLYECYRIYLADIVVAKHYWSHQTVILGDSRALWVPVKFGVYQVQFCISCLLLTMPPPLSLNPRRLVTYFSDDVQAFVYDVPTQQLVLTQSIDAASQDLHFWISSNRLSLNLSNTQLIWFGIPQQLPKLYLTLLTERFPSFCFSSSVRDLGVILDSTGPAILSPEMALSYQMICFLSSVHYHCSRCHSLAY